MKTTENYFVKGQETWELTKKQTKKIEQFVRIGLNEFPEKKVKILRSYLRDVNKRNDKLEAYINELEEHLSQIHKSIVLDPKTKTYTEKKDIEPVTTDENKESVYLFFLNEFNKITGKKYIPTIKSRELFCDISTKFTLDEIIGSLKNIVKNPYFKNERPELVSPEWFLKENTISDYSFSKQRDIEPVKERPISGNKTLEVADEEYQLLLFVSEIGAKTLRKHLDNLYNKENQFRNASGLSVVDGLIEILKKFD